MHSNKIILLTQTISRLIKEMPEESYFMVAKFSDSYEWLSENPLACTEINKNKIKSRLEQETKGRGGVDIAPLLKATLEMDFALDLPRSIIIVSNGNLKEQGVLERVMVHSRSVRNTRISCIGIGNGSCDSFLQVVSSKGCGLMDTICSPNQINDRIYLFMKRLRAKSISDIKFEFDESVFLKVLPNFDPNQKHLKSAAFEVQAFFRRNVALKRYSIFMYYLDEEDNSKKSLTIIVDLTSAVPSADMYKLTINELLLSSDELKLLGKDKPLVDDIGPTWAVKVAVDAQVFSIDTAYLAIAVATPAGFDPIKGSLNSIGLQKEVRSEPNKQSVVPAMVSSDYLKKTAASSTMDTSLANTKFSLTNFDLMSRRHTKEQSSIALSNTHSTNNTKDQSTTGSSAAHGLFSKADSDWMQSEERHFQEIATYVFC